MSFCLYNKKNITRRLEDMNFIFSWQKQYFTNERSEWVKYNVLPLENKIYIFAPPCNILYIYLFILLLCFLGARGEKITPSSRERFKGIIGRGHDLRLCTYSQALITFLNRANLLNRKRLDQEVSIERDLTLIGKMAACSVRRQCIFYRNVEV